MRFHLVIPARDESERLPVYLHSLLPALAADSNHWTLQVVDDGSGKDDAVRLEAALRSLRESYPLLHSTLVLPVNQGKGAAVHTGWKAAPASDFLGFVDADGSIPSHEVLRLAHLCESEPKRAVFASRVKMLGRDISRSAKRHYTGRIFATLVGNALHVPVYDSQCGCKFIPGDLQSFIQSQWKESRFAFDLELLLLLREKNVPVIECPIDWHDCAGSKVRLFRDAIDMARTVFRLRRRFNIPAGRNP